MWTSSTACSTATTWVTWSIRICLQVIPSVWRVCGLLYVLIACAQIVMALCAHVPSWIIQMCVFFILVSVYIDVCKFSIVLHDPFTAFGPQLF